MPAVFVNRVLSLTLAVSACCYVTALDFTKIDKVMERKFGWPMGPAFLPYQTLWPGHSTPRNKL
ncbi:3-hydroxyacyl-CoA dehydrogenase family protein [Vibrio chagasii]|nr:3-hydroxyacyl-CoA dehydrogenase family protein [Vibrio chagasii]